MSLLIPGPTELENDINVYLQPLIKELKELQVNGVETYDISKKQNFHMRIAVLWTINDFPAYANLSGWSTKGKFACPSCHYNTIKISEELSKVMLYGSSTFSVSKSQVEEKIISVSI